MTALRAQTIARGKARRLVLDDSFPAAPEPDGLSFLRVLGWVDAASAPLADRCSPTVQVLLSTALAVLVAIAYGSLLAARYAGRLLLLAARLALRLTFAVARRAIGRGSSSRPKARRARPWWARL